MVLRFLVLLTIGASAIGAVAADAGIDPAVRDVLSRHLKFSATQLADLERGKVARHAIETPAAGELAVAGAVRVNVSRSTFLNRLRDIVRFKKSPNVMQIGRFSNPPALSDLASLTVDRAIFDPRSCRTVGACDVRLPAEAIRRIERELDMNAPDLQARAAALFKQLIFEHVAAYVAGAGHRMVQFDGGPAPIRPLDEFSALLKNSPAVDALVPGLADHVLQFPHRRVAGAEDFLYWSKEKFGMAPFVTVTHVTIVCATKPTCVVTTKGVYASRYLDASLALTIASDAANQPDAIYLVYANRTRANALKARFSGLRRAIAERRARSGLEEHLKAVKIQLEKGS